MHDSDSFLATEFDEDILLRTTFSSRDEIDMKFFGGPPPYESGMGVDCEDFCERFAHRELHASATQSSPRFLMKRDRFPRRRFKRELSAAFGTMSVLWVVYYLVVAIYYWQISRK